MRVLLPGSFLLSLLAAGEAAAQCVPEGVQELTAPGLEDQFGSAVALFGDVAVVSSGVVSGCSATHRWSTSS